MKKTLIALLLCLALVAMTFASCSQNNTTAEDPTSENAVSEENSEETKEDAAEEVNAEVSSDEVNGETDEGEKENTAEENDEAPAEEPKLDEDIAVDPEKPEEVVNELEFDNVKLLAGIANAMGKATAEVTEEDINNIYYIGISKEATGDYTIYIGLEDFANALREKAEKDYVGQFLKKSVMDFAETDVFTDLGKFKNIITFEYVGIPISDVSFVKEYKNLVSGYFNNNGITDVSALADFNPENLAELDFTGNEIEDWTPLYHIKDKVYVTYSEIVLQNENGEPVVLPNILKLSDKIELEEQAKADKAEGEETKTEEKIEFVDENGNPADLSSLFE